VDNKSAITIAMIQDIQKSVASFKSHQSEDALLLVAKRALIVLS